MKLLKTKYWKGMSIILYLVWRERKKQENVPTWLATLGAKISYDQNVILNPRMSIRRESKKYKAVTVTVKTSIALLYQFIILIKSINIASKVSTQKKYIMLVLIAWARRVFKI